MDTSPRSGDRADIVIGLERDVPPGVGKTESTTIARRSNAPLTDSLCTIDIGGSDGTKIDVAFGMPIGRDRGDGARDATRQVPTELLDRLLVEARNACRRDGVAATRRELFARVAQRIGVSQAEVARRLRDRMGRGVAVRAPGVTKPSRPRDTASLLATRILGARELAVFVARRKARPDDITALHQLASELGIAVERVYELEASARRKLARALS